ncbi:MAG: hypothetical protein H6673_06365 [Anaerolineales bacterium]|nr:hypothetical protein [Anaerolineales bacterium]
MRRWMWILVLMTLVLAACGTSPKNRARQWAERFPEEVGSWELDTRNRTELSLENQSNYGYLTLIYEGQDDLRGTNAYLTIVSYATESAATVALEDEMLDWQVQGVRFETERLGRDRFDIAVMTGGQLIIYHADETVLKLRIVPEEAGSEISSEAITPLLELIADIAKNID